MGKSRLIFFVAFLALTGVAVSKAIADFTGEPARWIQIQRCRLMVR